MQFTASEDSSEEEIWNLILQNLDKKMLDEISSSSSSFYKTSDGIECSIRRLNGSLIANCYSESDRMGKRRWTIELT